MIPQGPLEPVVQVRGGLDESRPRVAGLCFEQDQLPQLGCAFATFGFACRSLSVIGNSEPGHADASPLAGMHATLLGGFCLLAGAILLALRAPWPVWVVLFLVALLLVGRGRD